MTRQSMRDVLGLTKKDFEPKANDQQQRIEDLENAIIELAELLTEGE